MFFLSSSHPIPSNHPKLLNINGVCLEGTSPIKKGQADVGPQYSQGRGSMSSVLGIEKYTCFPSDFSEGRLQSFAGFLALHLTEDEDVSPVQFGIVCTEDQVWLSLEK